jgi:hypothetical protein
MALPEDGGLAAIAGKWPDAGIAQLEERNPSRVEA